MRLDAVEFISEDCYDIKSCHHHAEPVLVNLD